MCSSSSSRPGDSSQRRGRNSSAMELSSRIAMARDWNDLFITDGDRPGGAREADAAEAEQPERRRGFFRRLRNNLSKTREALGAEVKATLLEGDVDEETWERLEEALIMADVGAATTARVVGELEQEASGGELAGGEALSRRLEEMLSEMPRTGADPTTLAAGPPATMPSG